MLKDVDSSVGAEVRKNQKGEITGRYFKKDQVYDVSIADGTGFVEAELATEVKEKKK